MIAYTTIGTNDLERAKGFYDTLLATIGGQNIMSNDRGHFYATAPDKPLIAVLTPFDGEPASVGNGMMVALAAENKDMVHKLHEVACASGGNCDGEPGPRGDGGRFYVAYFRDPDGNKLAAFTMNS